MIRHVRTQAKFVFALFILVAPFASTRPNATETVQSWWQPQAGATWQWQLTGRIDTSFNVDVYDLDLFETPRETVAALQADGHRVVCYVSVGTREDWRPDAQSFAPDLLGTAYDEWKGERWIDIRQIDRLAPVLGARLDLCRKKGFDAVEPVNVDGFTNETGFDISADDEQRFLRWIAAEAHQRGLRLVSRTRQSSP